MPFTPSPYQQAIFNFITNGEGHGIVEAVAGSGKTTTIIQAMDLIPNVADVAFLAFNKAIAQELQRKVPAHVQAMTLNSAGHRALMGFLPGRPKLDTNKSRNDFDVLFPKDDANPYGRPVISMVALAKARGLVPEAATRAHGARGLVADTDAEWARIIEQYGIALPDLDYETPEEIRATAISMARKVLARGIATRAQVIDFDDQLFLTVVLGVGIERRDWVFVDEAQDLSPIQIEMVARMLHDDGRLVAVGDAKQAIYGFRGAGTDSMERIAERFAAKALPLSITYRCPLDVVEMAQEIVPHIEAREGAPKGEIESIGWPRNDSESMAKITDDALVVCRLNAPLVSLAMAMVRDGRGFRFMGRDFAKGLTAFVRRVAGRGRRAMDMEIETFWARLDAHVARERVRLTKTKAHGQLEALEDRAMTFAALAESEDFKSPADICSRLEVLFADNGKGPTLCSIHRSKGLEAETVVFVDSHLCPLPWAKLDWQKDQEMNLKYVAITRAKSRLLLARVKEA